MELKDIENANNLIKDKEERLKYLIQEKNKEEGKLEDTEHFFDYLNNDDVVLKMDVPSYIHSNVPCDIVEIIKEIILPEREKILSEIKEEIKNIQIQILDMFKN